MKPKKPTFKRQHSSKIKRVEGKGWRHPRGIDSAQQRHDKSRGMHPRIGYSGPSETRGLHPTGVKELLVKNLTDLEGVGENTALRIASAVGKRKREMIVEKAKELKLKVLN